MASSWTTFVTLPDNTVVILCRPILSLECTKRGEDDEAEKINGYLMTVAALGRVH